MSNFRLCSMGYRTHTEKETGKAVWPPRLTARPSEKHLGMSFSFPCFNMFRSSHDQHICKESNLKTCGVIFKIHTRIRFWKKSQATYISSSSSSSSTQTGLFWGGKLPFASFSTSASSESSCTWTYRKQSTFKRWVFPIPLAASPPPSLTSLDWLLSCSCPLMK